MVSDKRYPDPKAKPLEERPGIKAQHAVFIALQEYLGKAMTGWEVEETPVGSDEDRAGVDIYLINSSTREAYLLDISFKEKDYTPYCVRIRDDWFLRNTDGSSATTADGNWIFRKECIQSLARAILPALSAPPIRRRR